MIRLGTRASVLALAQARAVAALLEAHQTAVEIVPMRTEGDRRADARLAAIGGKGLFVREIEAALHGGRIDIAVHSLKDLPASLPAGLCLAAFPEREDARDVLVTRSGGGLQQVRPGAIVGTSSPRRRALVLSVRPDLRVEPIRGNVDTRLRKLDEGGWDALVIAGAALRRLHLTPPNMEPLPVETFVPAVGQGILALETRASDRTTMAALEPLDHPQTRGCALAERAFLSRLGASCVTPMAAHARIDAGTLMIAGLVASEDGRSVLRAQARGSAEEASALGRAVAEVLLARGAGSITPLHPIPAAGAHT